jgi:GAF domain-containing protein
MFTLPAPSLDEELRLAALHACAILDTLPEAEFDEIVELAQQVCGAPAAALSFIDSDRQWLKASRGPVRGVAREHAFCNHTIQGHDALVVTDALQDPRFLDNPYVTGFPGIRFYAGVPLVTAEGARVGALCVLDNSARALDANQLRTLQILARQVSALLELRRDKADLQEALTQRDAAVARLEIAERIRCAVLEGTDASDSVRGAVRSIARWGNWDAGALWMVRADDAPLENVGGYWIADAARAPVDETSRQVRFVRGIGIAGAAWRAAAPVWLENLVEEPGLLRVAAMRMAGLSSGVAVPILAGARVVGVLELLSAPTRTRNDAEVDLLAHAAQSLATIVAPLADPTRSATP